MPLFKKMPYLLIMMLGCQSSPTTVDVLIQNVQIVDAINDQIISNQWVAIQGDSIFSVGAMNDPDIPKAKQIIDVGEKYIMPGLWDNHVHFRGGDSLIVENKELLKHFLSHGITTVRDAGGDITPAVLSWQKQIETGNLKGPTIYTSGPKLDGAKPAWAGSIKVTNAKQVEAALDSLESMGSDYVKIYDGSLQSEVYYQIIKSAEARGMKVTGHMPLSAKLMDAVALGLDGTEHMYYLLKACSAKEDSLTALGKGYGMMGALLETYDEYLADQVFRQLADRSFFVTPTLYIGKVLSGLAYDDHSQDSLLQFMGPGIQKTYEGRVRSARRNASSLSQNRNLLGDRFRAMIQPMHEAGVSILAGSDCGPYNSFVYPGASLLGELSALVSTGLTPAEALQCSYVNGPIFMNQSEKYGSVEAGKKADLILLSGNPLQDITQLQSLKSVIRSGKILDAYAEN